jgi:hypothetical protein
MNQLESFGLDMRFLLGLIAFLAILFIVVIAVWTGAKIWLFRMRRKREQRRVYRRDHAANGRPFPPSASGICERCEGVFAKVYHLPSGRRLCPECYEADGER